MQREAGGIKISERRVAGVCSQFGNGSAKGTFVILTGRRTAPDTDGWEGCVFTPVLLLVSVGGLYLEVVVTDRITSKPTNCYHVQPFCPSKSLALKFLDISPAGSNIYGDFYVFSITYEENRGGGGANITSVTKLFASPGRPQIPPVGLKPSVGMTIVRWRIADSEWRNAKTVSLAGT